MAVFLLMTCIILGVKGKEQPCPTGYTSKNGLTPGCKYEPCFPMNHKEIDQWERSVANKKLYGNGSLCDSFLKRGWYRPTSKAGNSMPNRCVYEGCGTVRPIWIKGNLPQTGEIANVTACASIYHNCCAHSYDIQVKNCTSFNIYNLVPTYGCAQAYCFGSELPCPTGYSSDTGFTPECTRTSSVLPVSSGLGVNGQTRTSPVIPVSPGARLNGQPSTLPVVPVSPGAAVNGKPGAFPVVPVSSIVGFNEHSNNNDRMWVSMFGVLCFLQIIAVVVYLMTKHVMKRKKLAKTASTAFDNGHYKSVSV